MIEKIATTRTIRALFVIMALYFLLTAAGMSAFYVKLSRQLDRIEKRLPQ